MSDDNVISLGTRKSFAAEREEKQKAEQAYEEHIDAAAAQHKKNMLAFVKNLKARIEANEIDGLVVAGRNPASGAFLSCVIMNNSSMRVDTYLAYAGILGAMQLDVTDLANNGPHMNSDGSHFVILPADEILLGDDKE